MRISPVLPIAIQEDKSILDEEFLFNKIAQPLACGQILKIDCGRESSDSARLTACGLTSIPMIKRIQRIDGQEITAQLSQELVWDSWLSFPKRHIFVTMGRTTEVDHCTDETDIANPDYEEIDDFVTERPNKYLNAKVLIIETPLSKPTIKSIEKWLKREAIIEVKRKNVFNKPETFGLYIEKELETGEIIFNLNGRSEEQFEDIFPRLVAHFLREGKTVLIDYDVENEDTVRDDILPNNHIYELITDTIESDIDVERRTANRFTSEVHTYVLIKPNEL